MNSEKWNPHKAIELADQNLKLFGPPEFKATLDQNLTEDLPYDEIRSFDNGQLEALFVIYGGYKAYLETKLSDDEALLGALESTHTEACNIAIHNIAREYDNKGKRKPTKEELRGEMYLKYPELIKKQQEIITIRIRVKKISGRLATYSSNYNTLSRVITLRNVGRHL